MADEKTTFQLDLDAKSFIAKGNEAFNTIDKIGSSNLGGLIGAIDKATPLLGALGVAIFAVKSALDATFHAEELKAINQQFEVLTKNAGLSGESLKSGLEKAADGLISTDDLLKTANKSIITLGGSAAKLPEIMELARKASVVSGKDIQSTFEDLTNAITTGNQRQLKNLGIVLDTEKAQKDYARSLGVTVSELSEAGKRQAILNATLEKGKTAYDDVDESIKATSDEFQRLKVSFKDIYDAFVLVFEKTMAPGLRVVIELMGTWARNTKRFFESAGKDVDYYRDKLRAMREESQEMGDKKPGGLQAPVIQESHVDLEKSKQVEQKFQSDLFKIREQASLSKIQLATNEQQVELALLEHMSLLEQDADFKKKALREQSAIDHRDRTEMLLAIDLELAAKLQQINEDTLEAKKKTYDNEVRMAQGAADQIALGFGNASRKARLELSNFTQTGEKMFNNFSGKISNAFIQIGEGSESVGSAMKKAIIGALADEAAARGSLLIASSIFPPNPFGLAAGAGLLTLAGALRSIAGGGSNPVSGGAVQGGGGGVIQQYTPTEPATATRPDTAGAMAPRKSVNLIIEGNYFETEQTRARLVEIIRSASDVTDYTVAAVGGGFAS